MDDPATIVPGVRHGEMLAGKYRIERVMGRGGMGVVVAARHLQLDERVAIKFLLPHAAQNGEAVARFAREARAAVKIKSEHVARVIDVGTLDQGAPYMVMEYLEGSDLGVWLKRHGPLPLAQAAEMLLQACEAIAEAHLLGIVHRDLKPANLFVIRRADGLYAVKVLDFGISKIVGASADAGITSMGAVLGSPLYMSPEQLQSARCADAQSDIWALGAILYELLSGRPPFQGDSLAALCVQILNAEPVPIRILRPELPAAVEGVIRRCLAKDRALRFADIAEFAIAVGPLAPERARASVERIVRTVPSARRASGVPVFAEPPAPVPADPQRPGAVAHTGGAWSHTSRLLSDRRSRRVLFAGLGGLGLLLTSGAIWLWKSPSGSTGTDGTTGAGAGSSQTMPSNTAPPPSRLSVSVSTAGNTADAASPPSPMANAADPASTANSGTSGSASTGLAVAPPESPDMSPGPSVSAERSSAVIAVGAERPVDRPTKPPNTQPPPRRDDSRRGGRPGAAPTQQPMLGDSLFNQPR